MADDSVEISAFDFRGGLNTKDSPPTVPETDLLDVLNYTFDRTGGLIKRNGCTKITGTALDGGSAVTGLFDARYKDGYQYLIAVTASGKVYSVDPDTGAATLATGGTGLPTSRTWSGLMYEATKLLLFPSQIAGAGVPPRKVTSAAGVVTVSALGGSPPNAAFGTAHARKVVAAGDPDNPLTVSWSKTTDCENWTAANDAGALVLSPNLGQLSRAAFPWFGRVVIGLESELWQITGTSGDATSPNLLTPSRFTEAIGCASPRTTVMVSTSPIITSYKGVHKAESLPTGFGDMNEQYLSLKIEPNYRALDTASMEGAHAVNYRTKNWYVLAVPGSASLTPTLLLVYDYVRNSWTIFSTDLADNTYTAQCIFRKSNVDRWYTGSAGGHIYRQDTGPDDNGTVIRGRVQWITSGKGASQDTTQAFLGQGRSWIRKWRHFFLYGVYSTLASFSVQFDSDFKSRGSESHAMTLAPSLTGYLALGAWTMGQDMIGPPDAVVVRQDIEREGRFLRITILDQSPVQTHIYGWSLYGDIVRKIEGA